ncbi:hypothetical protein [Agromyces seonyuensis]|uniref:hypothetical protein n=1 Tax=Agromyces seonyuensis TaxID=2662446 RepID=UPI001923D2EC|nr:hypothetical protein [Agromyces seonyuensis]
MPFLPETDLGALSPAQQAAADRQLRDHGGRITNMKATLLGHVPSFDAYMQWYTLWDELVPLVGDRAMTLFSYAISDANECLICSVFFRRILIDGGADPDDPQPTATESVLMDWGRAIARTPSDLPDELVARVESAFEPTLRLQLLAFAGLMVATNLLNTVGRIPLDDVLYDYRKDGDVRVD